MSGVEAVLLDLDGTLVEYERAPGEVLSIAFEAVGVDPFFEVSEYYARFESFLDETADAMDLRERCFADIARECGRDPDLGRAVARAYDAERDPERVRTLPGVEDAIESLAVDHALGIVTNGPPDYQRPKLDTLDLDDHLDVVVFAGFDAPAKPDPGAFESALSELDAPPGRAVHVGDSIESDVAGALAAGLGSAWVRNGSDRELDPEAGPRPDHVLESMRDLIDPPWKG